MHHRPQLISNVRRVCGPNLSDVVRNVTMVDGVISCVLFGDIIQEADDLVHEHDALRGIWIQEADDLEHEHERSRNKYGSDRIEFALQTRVDPY